MFARLAVISRRVVSAVRQSRDARAGSPRPAAWPTADRRAGSASRRGAGGTRPSRFCPNFAAQPSGVEQMSSSRACRSAPWSRNSAAFSTSPFRGELVQRRDAQPVRLARVHAVLEEQFVQLAVFADRRTNAPGQIGLIAQHQAHECLVAFARGIGQRVGIVGQRRIGREDRRRRLTGRCSGRADAPGGPRRTSRAARPSSGRRSK